MFIIEFNSVFEKVGKGLNQREGRGDEEEKMDLRDSEEVESIEVYNRLGVKYE